MKVQFQDKDGTVLLLTNTTPMFELPSGNSFDVNTKMLERFSIDGGYETGDGTIKIRKGDVGLTFIASTDLAFRTEYNRVANFFKPDKRPFYIVDVDNNLRQKISYQGINIKYNSGQEMRFIKGSIDYTAIDPFFESLTQITSTHTGLVPNDTFTVNINDTTVGSPNKDIAVYEAYPIIEITTNNTNADFVILNTTTNQSFRIVDTSFTAGRTITVNSEDGTIKNNTVINSKILSSGRPFKLTTGSNILKYQSPNATTFTVVVKYRRRYLI